MPHLTALFASALIIEVTSSNPSCTKYKPCDDDWHPLDNNKCYRFYQRGQTYADAKLTCKNEDADIALPRNQKEHQNLLKLIGSDRAAWINANDKITEGEWKDGSGDALDWTDWALGVELPQDDLIGDFGTVLRPTCVARQRIKIIVALYGNWDDISNRCIAKVHTFTAKICDLKITCEITVMEAQLGNPVKPCLSKIEDKKKYGIFRYDCVYDEPDDNSTNVNSKLAADCAYIDKTTSKWFDVSCGSDVPGPLCVKTRPCDMDECSPSPCKNGGICQDGVSRFTCLCDAGFTGELCDIDIDECSTSPCKNGGICQDGVNRFTCVCGAGFTGRDCGTATSTDPCKGIACGQGECKAGECDYCSPNQCDEGECVNKKSELFEEGTFNFTCKCREGYGGPHCRLLDDPCINDPAAKCKNGGTCKVKKQPGANDWFCLCQGKPEIGQAKDCSTGESDSMYPIPEKYMMAAVFIPVYAFAIGCCLFYSYECFQNRKARNVVNASSDSSFSISTDNVPRWDESLRTSPRRSEKKCTYPIVTQKRKGQAVNYTQIEDTEDIKESTFEMNIKILESQSEVIQ